MQQSFHKNKFRLQLYLKVVLSALLFSLISCTEETIAPKPGNPDDRQFEGTWLGNTSQTKLISFEVENSSQGPLITSCSLGYLKDSVYKQRILSDKSGLSEIIDGRFSFYLPDGGIVNGHFESPRSGNGNFTIFDEYSGDYLKYSFDAVSRTPHPGINATARVSFFLDGKDRLFEQDYFFYFPSQKNIKTDQGFVAVSGFNRKYGSLNNGVPLIEIRAGTLQSPDEIPRMFGPGIKQLSQNAGGGFEIVYYDPEEYFYRYSTSDCSTMQEWSKLEIIAFEEIVSGDEGYKLYKFIAEFHCKVCKNRRPDKYLAKGYYVGYIHTKI